jgi:hypothetical protein
MSVPSGTPAAPMPPGFPDDAVGDQNVADAVEIARRIDQPRVGERIGRRSVNIRRSAGCGRRRTAIHRHSHFHLFADQRLRAVGHDPVDLDAAVHRSGASPARRVWRNQLLQVEPE